MSSSHRMKAFTLIELLVVIAVIALLIGILLPALGAARESARTVKCSVSLKSVADGVAAYQATYRGFFPLSYAYTSPSDPNTPVWYQQEQAGTRNQNSLYLHWSYSVMESDGKVAEEAWKCPSAPKGGAPATNPGSGVDDSEEWQTGVDADKKDFQAKRMAYTGNAAIFARNKLDRNTAGTPRYNRMVTDAVVDLPSQTILAGEFLYSPKFGWQVTQDDSGENAGECKSHRPLSPIVGDAGGASVYNVPVLGDAEEPPFRYPTENEYAAIENIPNNAIAESNSLSKINMMGRIHGKGAQRGKGGESNFSFVDGHVEKLSPLTTIKKRLWGSRYYSLTGNNKIRQ